MPVTVIFRWLPLPMKVNDPSGLAPACWWEPGTGGRLLSSLIAAPATAQMRRSRFAVQ